MVRESIRMARVDDVPFIVKMINSATKEGVFHSRVISVEEFRKFAFENPYNRARGYQLLVWQIKDGIAGYIDSSIGRGVGFILGIYVKPSHRRRGIGKKLMSETLKSFKRRGCHKVRLEVFADNSDAIRFYKSLNFVQEGFLREDEEKKDAVIMSQFLEK